VNLRDRNIGASKRINHPRVEKLARRVMPVARFVIDRGPHEKAPAA
jgi:hypothetical protein